MKLRQRISLFLVAGLFTLGLTIAVTDTSNRPLTAAHTNAVVAGIYVLTIIRDGSLFCVHLH